MCISRLLLTTYCFQVSYHNMKLKLTLGMSLKTKFINIWSVWSRDFFWKRVLVFKLHTPFTKFIKSNFYIHSLCGEWHFKWVIVHQKIFQENSYDYFHDDVYKIYSSKTIHHISFQLISCQKICKKYVWTSNREMHMRILQTLSEGVKNVSIKPLIRAWKFS